MQRQHPRVVVAAGWVLTTCLIGVLTGTASVGAAALLVGFGLVPPLLMLYGWREPPQTLSQSIRKALR